MNRIDSRYWSWMIFLSLISVGVALALFVQRTTTEITDALAAEVLQQQSDVALLLHEYDALRLAFETSRLASSADSHSFDDVETALSSIESQLEVMRFNYSFERLDGAATAHAYVKPVIEDVRQWVSEGIPGLEPDHDQVISIASRRILERYPELRSIANETHQVANELINTQTSYLTRFGKSLTFLLAAFSLLALGISALLIRQRNLQKQIAIEQQQYAQKIKDFADTGADLFWEMNADLDLNMLSDRSLADKPLQLDEPVSIAVMPSISEYSTDRSNGILLGHWPLDLLQLKKGFSDFETEWRTESGGKKIIAVSGKPIFDNNGEFEGYRGIGRDITARRQIELKLSSANRALIEAETRGREQAEQALKESELFLRTSLNALPQRLAILDSNGRVVESNTAWKDFDLSSQDKPEGAAAVDKVVSYRDAMQHLHVPAKVIAKIELILKGDCSALRTEVRTRDTVRESWLAIALSPFGSNSRCYGVLAIEEITDRKQLEEQDRQLRSELAHFSRLTTVGELATGLAHELNQPLTAISHNCDALLTSVKSGAASMDMDDQDAIESIRSEADRAGAIIKGLRKLVRKETSNVEATDINQLVTDTIRLSMSDAHKHGIEVKLVLADNLAKPQIDSVQIQQVLVNLERNGVEAIRTNVGKAGELLITTAEDDDGFIKITVQDNGVGFPDIVRENLFSPFLTTKKDGMGMGLSISRSIIESHGGQLWVDFNHPDMTTFNFTLPVARPSVADTGGQ